MNLEPAPVETTEGRLLDDLRVFHDVARALTSTLDRDTVLRAIMAQMARFFSPQSWSLLLVDERRQDLYFAVVEGRFDGGTEATGANPDAGEGPAEIFDDKSYSTHIPFNEGMAGWVVTHGEPLIVPDVRAALGKDAAAGIELSPAERNAVSFEVQSVIGLPLQSRGQTLGVIQLFNYRVESLNDYAITFLHILTDYAAIAIENARAVEKIQELTITDDVTRLFNTRHLHALLQTEFERARRFQTEFSVIFLDLDHFKQVNDNYGHLSGTELLVEVAQLIQGATRSVDAVFRYGGDEFVVLLPQTGKTAAVEAAHRLRTALAETRFLTARDALREDAPISISASFGVATYPHDGDGPESILKIADGRMYSIKHATRNDIAFE
jgi:diguanylate cyclase (GGDEF)-like protein